MKVLLLYPCFPKTFWSFHRAMEVIGCKAFIPPLGIITVASLLPEDWEVRLYDRNVKQENDADWEWCDIVILSAMLAQKDDFLAQIRKAVKLGKKVAVGGPYPTSVPEGALEAGADYLILDEGEITVPQFLTAIAQGSEKGIFRADEKPDVTQSPLPRFDLLDANAYLTMAVQFSRGCPFNCEFCDIISLYGRKPRTKEPSQTLTELQALYDLGWRGSVLLVDDNFIGNKRNVKRLLKELIPWMQERDYPFNFSTEASVDLAEDQELLSLMSQAGFTNVFLGIETPDQDSLQVTRKLQNTRNPLTEACQKIHQAGMFISSGFIIGFDGERSEAGRRIDSFVEETSIAHSMLGLLQALPNTALWERLKKEQRLLNSGSALDVGDQSSLMNFVPTRPIEEIAGEYLETIWTLYEPRNYLQRSLHQCLEVEPNPNLLKKKPSFNDFKLLVKIVVKLSWLQGIKNSGTRALFWQQLWTIMSIKPANLGMYLYLCLTGEHFFEYRTIVRNRITEKLGWDPLTTKSPLTKVAPSLVSS